MSKVVLITGASSGFGEACAIKFGQAGHSLVLTARRGDKLRDLKSKLESEYNCANYVAELDVRDRLAIDEFVNTLPADFKNIDILVNNAGLALGLEPADQVDIADWDTMVDTNIKGLLYMTRAILPLMVQRNSGHIVNMGSIAGAWPYPGGNAYGASKAFVQQFSRELRADLLGKNIRVSNIDPGMAETNFSNIRFKGDDEKADSVYENTKPLCAEDIAEIIFWMCSVPQHVNINAIEVMPICQAWGALQVDRSMG